MAVSEEDKKEFIALIGEAMDARESAKAEAEAKANAGKEKPDDDGGKPPVKRSFAERILGGTSA
jgi:hypothetical protein